MIVPVTRENEQAWAALCIALWPGDNFDDWLVERAEGDLPHEYLYYKNNEPVAFISLALRHDYVEGTSTSPVGYLEAIYVKPEHQRHGIARELVEFAKNWAREQGCTEFASDCEWFNEDSRQFHTKVGFAEANRIVCFVMEI